MDDTQNPSDEFLPFIRVRSESGVETVHYSILYEGLPEEFRSRAEKELNETEENRKLGIQRLKDLAKKEKLDPLDDYLLLAVLRCCKFNLKKSEAKLRNFISYRRKVVQEIAKVDMADVDRIIEDLGVGLLPYRDQHGRAIGFTQPYGMHFEDYNVEDAKTVALALLLFQFTFELTTVSGVVYFGECKTPSIYIYFQVVRMFKQSLSTVLSFPLRIGKFEVMNEITLIHWFLRLLRPLVPSKLYNRLSLNGQGYDNLHKLYPPGSLPEEFGGTRGPMSSKLYKGKFMDFVRELKAEAQLMESQNGHHTPL